MSLFDKLFQFLPKPKANASYGEFKLLDGYTPRFTTFQGSLYESQLIRAAINARAIHISKLNVDIMGTAKPALKNKLKHAPNAFQSWSQFLYRFSTILDVHNTAFIVPIYDSFGELSGIYAPLPSRCEFVQYNDVPYLRYTFSSGETAAIELENCGILTKYQYKHDLIGDNNEALTPTLDLINIQNQGIQEGVKSAATYRFWAQVNNFSKAEDLAKERQRFSEENFGKDAKGGGLLLFPNTYNNINQVKADPWIIDKDQMQYIKDGVYEYFMVNEEVLTNKAYGDAWTAFYEGAIEPFAVQFSEVITKMIYTFNEQSRDNRIMLTANRLQYMSNAEKLNVSRDLLDRGVFTINQVLDIWNMPHVEGGDERIIRGEYYNATQKINEDDSSLDDSGGEDSEA